ncbi:septum formation initiator family protein [Crocinitomix catalasitica]|uniref:septum formation initiator family protein n=1 Tax=Crocinitomix catalasitica TaxID=184607 RepID=UPI0012FA1884|nr:septum formation initiator family protein [Crocinitomix catalasitica]
MKKLLPYLKNKYILSSAFVLLYILIMHDTDIVTLIKRKEKVEALELEITRKKAGIVELKNSIAELEDLRSLEKYAREKHFFKKENEELFIFSFE